MPLIQLYNGFYSFWGGGISVLGVGIFALGGPTTTTNVYNYSSNTATTGGALTGTLDYGAATGNSTVGIFALGDNTTTTNVYNYSSNTTTTGGALTGNLGYGAACSPATPSVS